MLVSVSVVSPRDGGPHRELQLTASAQPHKRGLDHVSLAWERSQCQIPNTVSRECILLLCHCNIKKNLLSQTAANWGPSVPTGYAQNYWIFGDSFKGGVATSFCRHLQKQDAWCLLTSRCRFPWRTKRTWWLPGPSRHRCLLRSSWWSCATLSLTQSL